MRRRWASIIRPMRACRSSAGSAIIRSCICSCIRARIAARSSGVIAAIRSCIASMSIALPIISAIAARSSGSAIMRSWMRESAAIRWWSCIIAPCSWAAEESAWW